MEWVGTRSGTTDTSGWQRIEIADSWQLSIDLVAGVRLLTTADGLSAWLATPSMFDARRGGKIVLDVDNAEVRGSYSLIDPPKRIVLSTELHGELDVAFDEKTAPATILVRLTRLVKPDEDDNELRTTLHSVLAKLKELTVNGG